MKRLSLLLSVCLFVLSFATVASAAETTTAEVPVTLTVIESQRQISVTVPAALPVSVVDGKVLTASNAAIRNHGKDPVAVTAISVKPGTYDIGSFDHFSGLAGTIALSLNGCGTTGAGSLPMTDAAFPAIEAGESLALRYQAKVALADTQDHAAAASVVFTISIVD